MKLLLLIQDSSPSTWIRESDWALFALLIVHTIGMALLAGTSISTLLRTLGVARRVPIALFLRFAPLMTYGLIAAIISGMLLVLGYPAKALTNSVFYFKLTVLAIAFLMTCKVIHRAISSSSSRAESIPNATRMLAVICLLLWIIGIIAGKFLAYTNTMLLVY